MKFSNIASVIAVLMCMLGAWLVLAGFYFGGNEFSVKRYLGSENPGHYIDRGVQYIVFGVVIGVLVEIGRSVTRIVSNKNAITGGID